jgi:O-antigen/teichoic acid export membrane protein
VADRFPTPSGDRVGGLARRGAKWSLSLLVVRQAVSIGTTAILARILPAEDFGMVAMVGTLTSLLMLVSDMGLSWAVVQASRLDQEQVDTLFWTGGTLGALAWGACTLAAPLLAEFYRAPNLVPLCAVLGCSLVISGFAIQPTAVLKRQMRQRELALSQTLAVGIAGAISIVLALAGARYWALAAQSISNALVLLIASLVWSGYRPSWSRFPGGAVSLLQFGGYLGASNVLTFLQTNLDHVLIGRYCGAEELGFYSRACFLRTLPATYAAMALTDVMVPAFAALRGERERLQAAFTRSVRLIAFVGCPIAAALGVTAAESVRVIYGPNWAPVVPMLVWLSFPALVLPLTQPMGWLFIASGKVRQMLFVNLAILPLVAGSYLVAVRWGALGVAWAAAALYTVPLPFITFYFAHAAAGLSLRSTLRAVAPSVMASVGAAAGALGAGLCMQAWVGHWVPVLAAKLVAGILIYSFLVLWLVRPLPLDPLERWAVKARGVFGRRQAGAARAKETDPAAGGANGGKR